MILGSQTTNALKIRKIVHEVVAEVHVVHASKMLCAFFNSWLICYLSST